MKKQIKYLLSLAVVFTVAACTKTVSLDDSVDNRVNAVITGYIDELSSAESGWIANISTDEGIYRFWMEFTSNNVVTMYTDNIHYMEYKDKPETTTYNIRSLLLPTLSFDTYSYIHIPNDPDDNVSGGSGNQGLNTDFEFEIDGYKDGVFSMTGRISRVPATLTRATAEEKAEVAKGGLMNVLEQTTNYKKADRKFCGVKLGTETAGIMFRARGLDLMWLDSSGNPHASNSQTYTDLNRNVNLVKPVEISGQSISAFHYDKTSDTYTMMTADGTATPLSLTTDPAVHLYDMMGAGKVYTKMNIKSDMYVSKGMTEEQIQAVKNSNAFYKNYADAAKIVEEEIQFGDGVRAEVSYATIEFYMESNRPRMMLTLAVHPIGYNQIIDVIFSYQLIPNEDTKQLTVGSTVKQADGNSQYFYQQNVCKALCDMFKQATFNVEWSWKEYGAEIMGELVLVKTGSQKDATVLGAIN